MFNAHLGQCNGNLKTVDFSGPNNGDEEDEDHFEEVPIASLSAVASDHTDNAEVHSGAETTALVATSAVVLFLIFAI